MGYGPFWQTNSVLFDWLRARHRRGSERNGAPADTFAVQEPINSRENDMAGDDQQSSDLVDELPLPVSPEARAQGCTCPDPEPGQGTSETQQVNMECHLHGLLWLLKEGKGEVL